MRAALDLVAAVAPSATRSARRSCARAPESSRARRRSRSAPRARGWSPATSSTRASRIQSVAEPGTVLVGEATRRATEADDRLRGRGSARAQGQGRAGARSGARSASSPAARRRSSPRGSSRRSSAATASCGWIKELFHATADESKRAAGLGRRGRRDRQVAPRVGVLQVLRRAAATDVLAPRPLPRVRRGRHVLGARGDGAHAGADRRGRGSRRARSAKLADGRRAAPARRGGARASSSRGSATSLGLEEGRFDRDDLFAAWRLFFERLADVYPTVLVLRGHAVGRRLAARLRRAPARVVAQPSRSSSSRSHARSCGASPGLGRCQPELHVDLPRAAARRRRCTSCSRGLVPGLPRRAR